MTDHDPDDRLVVHTIPVPVGWSIEQAWTAISRGDRLEHPHGEPSWANVLVDAETDALVRILPSTEQLRERARNHSLDLREVLDICEVDYTHEWRDDDASDEFWDWLEGR